jgi:hypothetical protein
MRLFLLTLLFPTLLIAAPPHEAAVPALIVGAPNPNSFLAEGIFRFSATGAIAFRVATENEHQICALYDPSDGTPLFFSDGHQTLIYDLQNSRIVRLPNSRGNVRIDWNPQEKKLVFAFNVTHLSNPEKLTQHNSHFRLDQFVEASAPLLKRVEAPAGTILFAAEREGGKIESIQKDPKDPRWFRFTSQSKEDDFYRLELDAKHINQQLPATALFFPDLEALKAKLPITEIEDDVLPTFLVILRDGRAWLAKLALAGGPKMRQDAEKLIPNANWKELSDRDAKLGADYRAALAAKGIRLRLHKPDPPPAQR